MTAKLNPLTAAPSLMKDSAQHIHRHCLQSRVEPQRDGEDSCFPDKRMRQLS